MEISPISNKKNIEDTSFDDSAIHSNDVPSTLYNDIRESVGLTRSTTSLLASIEKQAKELNLLSDQANTLVKTIEDMLVNQYGIGITANIDVNVIIDSLEIYKLGFGKYKSSWKILIEYGFSYSHETISPWLECPREVKLHTISCLPVLLNDLNESLKQRLIDTKKSLNSVKNTLSL